MLKFVWPGPAETISCHNHSDWSDGASSLEEMCRAAKAAGLRKFGLSDHWVVMPEGKCSWSLPLDRLDDYVAALQRMQQELNDDNFTLLIGLEVDYFPENADAVLAQLRQYPIDYLIGSVHFAGRFGVDESKSGWEKLTEKEKETVCEIYWQKLAGAAARKEFTFLGHLDLPKKFAMIRRENDPERAAKVLDILEHTGGAIELNTAGWFKEVKEPYPSPAILREAFRRRIPVVITSDAHHVSHLTRAFDEAAAYREQAEKETVHTPGSPACSENFS